MLHAVSFELTILSRFRTKQNVLVLNLITCSMPNLGTAILLGLNTLKIKAEIFFKNKRSNFSYSVFQSTAFPSLKWILKNKKICYVFSLENGFVFLQRGKIVM